MSTEPDPSSDLVPPGPSADEVAERRTGPLPVDEWMAENRRRQQESGALYGSYGSYASNQHLRPASQTMANWALGLSLALCIPFAFLVGAGLAIAVLVKGRDGRNHGKGKAIASLIIGALILVVNVIYVVVVVFTGVDETRRDSTGQVVDGGSVTLERLQVGDCFTEPSLDDVLTDEDRSEASGLADVVPCSDPHQAEVFHEFDVAGDDFPGDAVIERRTADCLPAFKDYVGKSFQRSQLDVVFYFPTSTAWRFGDHEITCVLLDPDMKQLNLSMAGSRR